MYDVTLTQLFRIENNGVIGKNIKSTRPIGGQFRYILYLGVLD